MAKTRTVKASEGRVMKVTTKATGTTKSKYGRSWTPVRDSTGTVKKLVYAYKHTPGKKKDIPITRKKK